MFHINIVIFVTTLLFQFLLEKYLFFQFKKHSFSITRFPCNIPIKNVKGKAIAFLSYTDSTNGLLTPDDTEKRTIYTSETSIIRRQLEEAKKKADVVIVGCHWGNVDSHVVSDDQKNFAKFLAENGADMIIGTHPHVVEDAEWLETKDGRSVFCAYSLGNFFSAQMRTDELVGMVLECNIKTIISPTGEVKVEIEKPLFFPIITDYGNGGSEAHVKWLSEYSPAEAKKHGVRNIDNQFTYQYINKLLKKNVQSEFLVLPE